MTGTVAYHNFVNSTRTHSTHRFLWIASGHWSIGNRSKHQVRTGKGKEKGTTSTSTVRRCFACFKGETRTWPLSGCPYTVEGAVKENLGVSTRRILRLGYLLVLTPWIPPSADSCLDRYHAVHPGVHLPVSRSAPTPKGDSRRPDHYWNWELGPLRFQHASWHVAASWTRTAGASQTAFALRNASFAASGIYKKFCINKMFNEMCQWQSDDKQSPIKFTQISFRNWPFEKNCRD